MRLLERRAAQGDAEARSRLLRERVRASRLSDQQVSAAAYLGDEAARASLGEAPKFDPDGVLDEWLFGLRFHFGHGVYIAALYAIAELAVAAWETRKRGWWEAADEYLRAYDAESVPRRLLNAFNHWIHCPCLDHERGCWSTADRLWGGRLDGPPQRKSHPSSRLLTECVNTAIRDHLTNGHSIAGLARSSGIEGDAIREAVRGAILPWARGD